MIRRFVGILLIACAGPALAASNCITSGDTTKYTYFVAVDSTDKTTRETGLSSFTVYRSRNGGTATAFTTPTINETDSTNMPGVYELLLDEDMTIGAGSDVEHMVLHITHAGMEPVTKEICIARAKVTPGETLSLASLGIVANGTAQGGTSTTIQLASSTSIADDHLVGATVMIVSGTGAGQSRGITGWESSTDTATVSPAWETSPSSDSGYIVFGTAPTTGGSGGGSGPSAEDIAEAVAAELGTGTQFTAIPWNSAWDAEVESEVIDALNVYDPPTNAEMEARTLPSASYATATDLGAVKAKTDNLTFTVSGQVDANVQSINDTTIVGDGSGTPFNVSP